MRIEKIELIGFKSFSDKTVFNLHPGITCIVGPNGCGKSNVVDSFRWVLGEQSAKSLRGDSMQEVIFTGSQTKKPRGMAEVTLYVSGLDSSEDGKQLTTVTRRLYRSGDSDYLLNGTVCRLRDVRDLFLDTGLEVKSYSILEQDRISDVLSAKPEERRFLIEEVAGVVKYKVRRSEAQSKLESSRRNLDRISDITTEVKRQINSLDRQVKKAERYKRLMEELKSIELRIASMEYTVLSEELNGILNRQAGLKQEETLRRAELARTETELETGRIGLLEKEKRLAALQAELQGTEKDMAELERSIAVSGTERDNLREYAVKLRLQEEENKDRQAAANRRRGEIAASKEALQAEINALKEAMSEKTHLLASDEDEIAEKEKLLDSRRRDVFRVSDALSHLRNERNRYHADLENLLRKQEGIDREAGELTAYLDEATSRLKDVEASIIGRKNETRLLAEEKEILDKDVQGYKERLETLRADIALEREKLASALSRLESLKEMVSAESAELKDLNLVAAISDVIEVPRQYENAIESALGTVINGFILPGYEDVKLAVHTLKAEGMGKTAFIPLNVQEHSRAGALPEGAISWAADLVEVREEFSTIIKNLLDTVAVVNDLETALKVKAHCVPVTLDGEIVEPSGAVIAGLSKGILTLKRQIRELALEIEDRKAGLETMQKQMETGLAALEEKETVLEDMGQKAAHLEKELSVLSLTAEKHNEDIERTNKKLAFLRLETDEVSREKESLKNLILEKDAEISALEQEIKHLQDAVSGIQEEITGKKAVYEQQRTESVDIRLSLGSSKEKLRALQGEEESIEGQFAELREKERHIGNEIAYTGARIKEREEEISEKEAVLKELAVKASDFSTRISAQRDSMAGESEALMAKEKGLKELRNKIELSARGLSELDVQRAEHRLKMENLKDNIKNTYDIELEAVRTEPVRPEDEETLQEVKAKIEALGPVSLGSIEEYDELRQRYEFLTKQQEDLQRSIAELEEAIKKINSTTRKKLREAYEALRAKFSEVFITLFGGGRAELILTDESNILETGIDIVAQPPGKKLQNINLLSGGEKVLAALALLFSSFLIKPTPLCILDEADAALDEANTGKFAGMLKDLSADIQFIVITHNRVTMESSDYIYGITMEEPGTSKVISLELQEA